MTKSTDKPETTPAAPTGDKPGGAEAAAARPRQVQLDDSGAVTSYANFCRVTGTPEELILDFGLNAQPMGVPSEPVKVNQRLVTNYYTAKRMLYALQATVKRHEDAFGVLETDIQKRVLPGVRQAAQQKAASQGK